ncbi:MAG: ACT domain-containing protein [Limnochordia bacterium]|jgi:hypothetical protein
MKVKQMSIFLENKSGRLAALSRALAEQNINIRALSLADTADFGILRLIVDDPQKGYAFLKQEGFAVRLTDVLVIRVPDRPGGLAKILDAIHQRGLNVEYMYAFVQKAGDDALVIVRMDDLDNAIGILKEMGVGLLGGDEVYAL